MINLNQKFRNQNRVKGTGSQSSGSAGSTKSGDSRASNGSKKETAKEQNRLAAIAAAAKQRAEAAAAAVEETKSAAASRAPSPKAAPKVAAKSSLITRSNSAKAQARSSSTDSVKSVNRDFSMMDDPYNSASFKEFHKIFNAKYTDGNPLVAMFLALNDMSEKYCKDTDERCDKVLKAELMRIASGTERAISDDLNLFSRFVNILNANKGEVAKLFGNGHYDADFFNSVKSHLREILIKHIKGIEVNMKEEKMRLNLTGEKSRVHWDSIGTFVMNIVANGKFLNEGNLVNHISSTHKMSEIAKELLDTITETPTSKRILALSKKDNFLPEILKIAMVYRALGDNGTLVKDGAAGVYKIPEGSRLGPVLKKISKNKDSEKFLSYEDGEYSIPFGNVSNLISMIFPIDKADPSDKTAVRTPINLDVYARESHEFVSLAVAFRYESIVLGKIRSAAKNSA